MAVGPHRLQAIGRIVGPEHGDAVRGDFADFAIACVADERVPARQSLGTERRLRFVAPDNFARLQVVFRHLVLLGDQDRSSWDRPLIEEGHAIVRACLRRNQPGPYQIQAAINAVHADADSFEATDWSQILALYDQLLAITATPVVAMNRAIALGEVEGPGAALDVLDALGLGEYHLYHAARADLLRRLGRQEEASQAYARAAALAPTDAERTFLTDRLETIRATG